jgi:predicted nucleic acid-binding protein
VSSYVVDANVPIKWFVPEALSAEAIRLARGRHRLIAPDLLYAEAGNALWQKVQRGSLKPGEARDILRWIGEAPLEIHALRPLGSLALGLAIDLGCSVYDGCYLGLALGQECPLVTADERLLNRLPEAYATRVIHLSAVPA